ncbi:MAG: hypothetical protein U0531_08925 [Dehalococcoidia bacterium]
MHGLAETAAADGDHAEAGRGFVEAARLALRLGMQRHVALCLDDLATVVASLGRPEAAARALGAAAALRAGVGSTGSAGAGAGGGDEGPPAPAGRRSLRRRPCRGRGETPEQVIAHALVELALNRASHPPPTAL